MVLNATNVFYSSISLLRTFWGLCPYGLHANGYELDPQEPQHRKPQLTRKTLFVLGAMNLIDAWVETANSASGFVDLFCIWAGSAHWKTRCVEHIHIESTLLEESDEVWTLCAWVSVKDKLEFPG